MRGSMLRQSSGPRPEPKHSAAAVSPVCARRGRQEVERCKREFLRAREQKRCKIRKSARARGHGLEVALKRTAARTVQVVVAAQADISRHISAIQAAAPVEVVHELRKSREPLRLRPRKTRLKRKRLDGKIVKRNIHNPSAPKCRLKAGYSPQRQIMRGAHL